MKSGSLDLKNCVREAFKENKQKPRLLRMELLKNRLASVCNKSVKYERLNVIFHLFLRTKGS